MKTSRAESTGPPEYLPRPPRSSTTACQAPAVSRWGEALCAVIIRLAGVAELGELRQEFLRSSNKAVRVVQRDVMAGVGNDRYLQLRCT